MELIALAAAAIVLLYLAGRRPRKRQGDVIKGWAKVTDGDGIKVKGYPVRLAGLDAPEWNQKAKHRFGFWFNHGKRVKRALTRELAFRRVQVRVEGYDRYGRIIGTVSCRGMDVGEWLVRSGHAIAAFDSRYRAAEREAKSERRGMWGYGQGLRSEGLAAPLVFQRRRGRGGKGGSGFVRSGQWVTGALSGAGGGCLRSAGRGPLAASSGRRRLGSSRGRAWKNHRSGANTMTIRQVTQAMPMAR